MADSDDFIPWANAYRQQGQVKRRGAARHRTGVLGTHEGSELTLEGRHLLPLGHPARPEHRCCGLDLILPNRRLN